MPSSHQHGSMSSPPPSAMTMPSGSRRRQQVVRPSFIPENVAGGAAISPSHMVPGALDMSNGVEGGMHGEMGRRLEGGKDWKDIKSLETSPSFNGSFVSESKSLTRTKSLVPASSVSGGIFERLVSC